MIVDSKIPIYAYVLQAVNIMVHKILFVWSIFHHIYIQSAIFSLGIA